LVAAPGKVLGEVPAAAALVVVDVAAKEAALVAVDVVAKEAALTPERHPHRQARPPVGESLLQLA